MTSNTQSPNPVTMNIPNIMQCHCIFEIKPSGEKLRVTIRGPYFRTHRPHQHEDLPYFKDHTRSLDCSLYGTVYSVLEMEHLMPMHFMAFFD